MAEVKTAVALKDLSTLFNEGRSGLISDGQLLERFIAHRDSRAFEALVERHGPMVLRVCRGFLNSSHDADDAFQATFLVLARKAKSIQKRESLASWLFGVAGRVSARARVDALKRRQRERDDVRLAVSTANPDSGLDFDLSPLLHDELRRLPERYRDPLLLYYLEGKTCEEVANLLHCPLGTVKNRLYRARNLLKGRLTRRGITIPAGLLAAGTIAKPTSACVPVSLVAVTLQAVIHSFSESTIPLATSQTTATILAERVLISISLKNLATLASVILVLGTSATLGGVIVLRKPGEPSASIQRVARKAPQVAFNDRAKINPSVQTNSLEDTAIREGLSAAEALEDPTERARILRGLGAAQFRQGRRELALDTLEKALQVARTIPPKPQRLYPQPILMIGKSLAEMGEHAKAQRTFELSIPIIQAMEPLDQLSNWPNLLLFHIQSEGRKAARESIKAYRHYMLMQKDRDSPYVIATLAGLDAYENGPLYALRKLQDSKYDQNQTGPNIKKDILLSILDSLQPEDRSDAEQVLNAAKDVLATNDDTLRIAYEIPKLVKAQLRLGLIAEAIKIMQLYESKVWPQEWLDDVKFQEADAYAEIADKQLKIHDNKGAQNSAQKILQIVSEIKNPTKQPYHLSRAATVFIEIQDCGNMLKTIDSLKHIRGVPDFFLIETLWASLAKIQRRAGDQKRADSSIRQAIKTAEEHRQWLIQNPPGDQENKPEYDFAMQAITSLACLQAEAGELQTALKTINSLKDEIPRQHALIGLTASRAANGDVKTALELAKKIESPKLAKLAQIQIAVNLPAKSTPALAQ